MNAWILISSRYSFCRLSPNAETNSPYSSSPVCLNTTKTKRLSKGRKSHSRRSSVHTRLSISHRRSSGPQRTRLSKRLMSALKRKVCLSLKFSLLNLIHKCLRCLLGLPLLVLLDYTGQSVKLATL